MKIAALLVFVIVGIIAGPLLGIWSLNTLFGLEIAYTFWTWCAALVIGAYVYGSSVSVKSS